MPKRRIRSQTPASPVLLGETVFKLEFVIIGAELNIKGLRGPISAGPFEQVSCAVVLLSSLPVAENHRIAHYNKPCYISRTILQLTTRHARFVCSLSILLLFIGGTPMYTSDHASGHTQSGDRMAELQQIEAAGVTRELDEFMKLIQGYKSLYLPRGLLFIGWILSQDIAIISTSSTVPHFFFDEPRLPLDIAAVLYIIASVSALFGLLILKASAQSDSCPIPLPAWV